MGVYKRPECEWKGGKPTWYYQFTHQKQRYYDGIFATRKEAKDAEEAKKRELKSKRQKTIPLKMAIFSEFVPIFLKHRMVTKAARTAETERRKLTVIARHFGRMRVSNITIADINNYVATRKQEGISSRTTNLHLTLLRSFFKHAIDCGVTDYNPAREVENLKQVQTEKWIPSKHEMQRFVDCAAKTSTGKYIVPWIWFRAYTGTRPTESFFMEWDDIDFDLGRIYIRPKNGNELKNGKFRVVEMHSELRPILLDWKQEWEAIHERWLRRNEKYQNRNDREIFFDHQWVFIHPNQHGRRAETFTKSFYKAREMAGLPKMTSHTLRHYFISQCVMSGINLFTIAKWVGHANTRMIEETYGHLNDGFRKEQMAMLKVV